MRGSEELDQLDELERRFIAALGSPAQQARAMNRALLRTLPRHVRLRLWCTHKRDGAAIWLVYHDHFAAAEAVWRLTGAWRRRTG